MAFDAVFDLEVGAGVAGLGGGEFMAEPGNGAAAAGRGRGVEPQVQSVAGDVDVAGRSLLLRAAGPELLSAARG